MRGGILGVGVMAMVMGITIKTIYGLWYLCADLVYVILFPQLVSVVHLSRTNTYGSLAGYCVGMFFRIAGGEPLMYLPAMIEYPGFYYESPTNWYQRFPFRTLTMLLSFGTIVSVSYLMNYLFESGKLRKEQDIFLCVVNIPEDKIEIKEPFAPTPSPMAEMAILKGQPIRIATANGGQINPALKFSKDDLLSARHDVDTQVSPLASSEDSEDSDEKGPYAPR